MQFLVLGYDGVDGDALSRRQAVRSAHLALGDTMRANGEMLYAVAMLNSSEEMCGSVVVLELPDRTAVDLYLEKEPYVTGNVWQRIEVVACKVGPSFMPAK